MELVHNRCKFTDKQMVKVQETPGAFFYLVQMERENFEIHQRKSREYLRFPVNLQKFLTISFIDPQRVFPMVKLHRQFLRMPTMSLLMACSQETVLKSQESTVRLHCG